MYKKAADDVLSPSLFLATHWYLPLSSIFTSVIISWLWLFLLSETTLALTLDVTAYELLFFIHEMAGVGRPMAVQLKVTLEPMKALWFFGFSTTSGNRRWGAKRDNQKAKVDLSFLQNNQSRVPWQVSGNFGVTELTFWTLHTIENISTFL